MDWITKYFSKFEREFDPWPAVDWLEANWWHSIPLALIYGITIFTIQRWLTNRQPLILRKPLVVWNSMLTIFSIIGATRTIPGLYDVVSNRGIYSSICLRENRGEYIPPLQRTFALWTLLFIFSKPVELIDTVFLVLRKKPLMFLHWYHHITVMIYAFHAGQIGTPSGRWFLTINYVIHTLMYGYYAICSLNVKLPAWIGTTITVLQIVQMAGGVIVTAAISYAKYHGWHCLQTNTNLAFALLIYFSYLLLFAHFFYFRQIRVRKQQEKEKAAKKEKDSLAEENLTNNNNITTLMNGTYINGDTNAHKRSMHKALAS